MAKLILDIECGSNGGYVVTWYKKNPGALLKLAGEKQEKEQLAFASVEALTKWIKDNGK